MTNKIKAYAKVNIGLNVFGKAHGAIKHQMQSLFMLVDYLYDEIEIKESEINWIEYYQNNKLKSIRNDIVTKCLNYLREKFLIKQPYEITIHKSIPESAGLGGSSTDGAAVMKEVMRLNHIPLDALDMVDVAINLGSDIPFFLSGYELAEVANYGDYVRQIHAPLPNIDIIPTECKCDTKMIYDAFDNGKEQYVMNDYQLIINHLPHLKGLIIHNNLEPYALKLNPSLQKYKTKDTLLTGSGGYFVKWN